MDRRDEHPAQKDMTRENGGQPANATVTDPASPLSPEELSSQRAFGAGYDAAGMAYALRALEQQDSAPAAIKPKSFTEIEIARRKAKQRGEDKDTGRSVS